ncbi:MAG: YaeQ family protein [Gammaproteobacteria bacterium]|nr:YaeQ family protein [Gammaproteobacteria bacterium]
MALKSSVFKADIQIADLDRHFYENFSLTLARHPSETDERMMVRLMAFILHAQEGLSFGKGLSTEDEPDLWLKNMVDEIELWIEVGQPDEKRLRKAAGRSRRVCVYCYGNNEVDNWWHNHQRKLKQMDKLSIYRIPAEPCQALTEFVQRTMHLQCTIQDDEIMLTDGQQTVQFRVEVLKAD